MGWEAYATKDGQDLEMEQGQIADPALRAAFAEASAEVIRQAGWVDGGFREGCLDGWSRKLVLELATGVVCFDEDRATTEIEWSSEYVHWLQAGVNWNIPKEHEEEQSYPDWYDPVDYWAARVFFQTCSSHDLGMLLTW